MATKKQKREALELKRAQELEETRQAGLKALERDRARRERIKQKRAAEEAARLEKEQAEKTRLAMLDMAGAGCGD